MTDDVTGLFTSFKAIKKYKKYTCAFLLWGITKQIATGVIGHYENCFPSVGKCYPRPKTNGNISQVQDNNFH